MSVLDQHCKGFIPIVPSEECRMNTRLLHLWQFCSKDPDDAAISWLHHGAPAGIITQVLGCSIFPEYREDIDVKLVEATSLETPLDFVNYHGVEEAEEAKLEMKRLHDMGYIHRCSTWEEATSYLGGTPPVLSKLGLIIKERAGKRKVRLVIDSKQSQVSKASRKFQRIELPKIIHAVWDMLELCQLDHSNPSHELEHMVADFKDAFFLLPNCRAERQFFAV